MIEKRDWRLLEMLACKGGIFTFEYAQPNEPATNIRKKQGKKQGKTIPQPPPPLSGEAKESGRAVRKGLDGHSSVSKNSGLDAVFDRIYQEDGRVIKEALSTFDNLSLVRMVAEVQTNIIVSMT
jgi:hypothetical protein